MIVAQADDASDSSGREITADAGRMHLDAAGSSASHGQGPNSRGNVVFHAAGMADMVSTTSSSEAPMKATAKTRAPRKKAAMSAEGNAAVDSSAEPGLQPVAKKAAPRKKKAAIVADVPPDDVTSSA